MPECTCEPQNAPWMSYHITSCPFYPWTEEARRLAFQQHYRNKH